MNHKKVILNQDSHYKSQIVLFNFAMNISLDDLIRELNEVKKIFCTSATLVNNK